MTDFDRQFLEVYGVFIAVLAALSFCAIRARVAVFPLMVVAASINLICLLADWVVLRANPWSIVWPLSLVALMACLPGAMCTGIIILVQHWRLSALKRVILPLMFVVLTVVHCFIAMMWTAYSFPKA